MYTIITYENLESFLYLWQPANNLLFMIAWNILTLAYFELNFPIERSEPILRVKIYHLYQSE